MQPHTGKKLMMFQCELAKKVRRNKIGQGMGQLET